MKKNTITETDIIHALSLAIQMLEVREYEMVRRVEEQTGRKQPNYKSVFLKKLEKNLDKAIKGTKLTIV